MLLSIHPYHEALMGCLLHDTLFGHALELYLKLLQCEMVIAFHRRHLFLPFGNGRLQTFLFRIRRDHFRAIDFQLCGHGTKTSVRFGDCIILLLDGRLTTFPCTFYFLQLLLQLAFFTCTGLSQGLQFYLSLCHGRRHGIQTSM